MLDVVRLDEWLSDGVTRLVLFWFGSVGSNTNKCSNFFTIITKYFKNKRFFYKKMYVIVITFYSPSCLGQETAKGPFGLQVKLPPAHLSTTHTGGFTQSL